MSFEDTTKQVATPEVDAPVKKRGRPAGAKNKEPVTKKTTANPLASKLLYAEMHVVKLEDDYKKLRQRYKTEVDGLMAIVSYLEATLKDTWQKDAIDAASV